MQTAKANWGGLTCYVVHDLPADAQPQTVAILCHGYGAAGTDLVGLAQPLLTSSPKISKSTVLVFPAAPLSLREIGIPGARAWWPVDLDRLINHPTPDLVQRFREATPPGLAEARAALRALLTDAGEHFGLSLDRFVLGGFSQGAMLTTDLALRLPTGPAALLVLSGALVNESEWRRFAASHPPLRVLQSHGLYDSILPLPMAAALRDLLLEAGAEIDFFTFPGDHEIPLEVIQRVAGVLESLA